LLMSEARSYPPIQDWGLDPSFSVSLYGKLI
jgi:hypothetical protein